MTANPDLDRILDRFLGEGPSSAPDLAIEAALDRVLNTSQRRRPLFSWSAHMPVPVRVAFAVALLVALLGLGVLLVGGRGPEPVPAPAATPSPAATVATPSTTPSATPPATPVAAVTPPPVAASVAVVNAAVSRLDQALGASRGPTGLSLEDQNRLLQLLDGVREALDGALTPAGAAPAVDALATEVQKRSGILPTDIRARLLADMATLQGAVGAVPVPSGALPAGTYLSTAFSPAIAFTVPEGWSRGIEDKQVLVLRKGDVQVAFNSMGPEASEAGVGLALGRRDPATLDLPPEPVTLHSYPGFVAGFDGGGGTLWFTDGLQPFDARLDDAVRAWVLQAGPRPVTAHLVGPGKAVAAVQDEVEAMLGSLVVP